LSYDAFVGVFLGVKRLFCPPKHPDRSHEAHPSSYSVGTGILYEGIKRPGHQVGHSTPSTSTGIKIVSV